MDPFDRFVQAVSAPPDAVLLDEAGLAMAAVADCDVDVDRYLGRLDDLAAACPAPTLDALMRHLFGAGRFSGNADDYYDPRNSLLSEVLDRGLGIPISLSVVAMEVGRRLGVPLSGVGMPGHFLLRDKVDPSVFADPFHGGRLLDAGGCHALFRSLAGAGVPWDEKYLEPLDRRMIVVRMLANLEGIYARHGDLGNLRWVLRLRAAIPGTDDQERGRIARLLAPLN